MECRLCGHPKSHKHGKMPNGHQRFFCPQCKQTFAESFDTLYYWRLVVSYFNWIWRHRRFKTTAAQRAKLTDQPWTWHDIVTYPTIV